MDGIILASASTGRRDLFKKYFYDFTISISNFDENSIECKNPKEYVRILALKKAEIISEKFPKEFVIGFDTIVLCEGKILGKPADIEEGKKMLRFLSGKKQRVLSGYAVIHKEKKFNKSGVAETILLFKELSDEFIEEYTTTHPVTRFAGGYGIQNKDDFISIITGSFDNVIGAPMKEVIELLLEGGMKKKVLRKYS